MFVLFAGLPDSSWRITNIVYLFRRVVIRKKATSHTRTSHLDFVVCIHMYVCVYIYIYIHNYI